MTSRSILFATVVISLQLHAADRAQPIQVEADNLTVEEATGVSIYSGNVTVNQGTLNLWADQVRIFTEQREIVRIVASVPDAAESFAHYEQLPSGEHKHVEGQARRIVYHVREERLEFVGQATLSQAEETTVSGDTVNYDAAAGRVNATAGEQTRVKTTIRQNGREDE